MTMKTQTRVSLRVRLPSIPIGGASIRPWKDAPAKERPTLELDDLPELQQVHQLQEACAVYLAQHPDTDAVHMEVAVFQKLDGFANHPPAELRGKLGVFMERPRGDRVMTTTPHPPCAQCGHDAELHALDGRGVTSDPYCEADECPCPRYTETAPKTLDEAPS